MIRLLLAAIVVFATLAGFAIVQGMPAGSAASGPEGDAPITSADPTLPVPFVWSTTQTHSAGSYLNLQGGTLHAIPSAVRLIGPGGVVAESDTKPVVAGEPGLCGEENGGLVTATLAVTRQMAETLGAEWADGYRLEALVGSEWRETAPIFAGCVAME
jgi:hypothetical protein